MKNYRIYLVGGAVRDKLLGVPAIELDWVVVGLSENQMLKMGFHRVGKDFPVFLHPINKEEYALARREKKIGKGYHGFKCETKFITLKEDLYRRDLTINSIALSDRGRLSDKFFGRFDILHRKFKHVSVALKEDPVRILRIARFCARFFEFKFSVSIATSFFMKEMVVCGDIKNLTIERIWKECVLAFKTNNPCVFFETLYMCGALNYFFLEIYDTYMLSKQFKFNITLNIWKQLKNVLCFILKFNNKAYIKFSIFSFFLMDKSIVSCYFTNNLVYKKNKLCFVYKVRNKYKISNNYFKFSLFVIKFFPFYCRLFKLKSSFILYIFGLIKANKDKIGFIDILLVCKFFMMIKFNKFGNHKIYTYFCLDILDELNLVNVYKIKKGLSNIQLKLEIVKVKKGIISKYKYKYLDYF